MAKKQRIIQTTKSRGLKITHPDTAGIDVGKDLMQVSVPQDRAEESNRSFGTFTCELAIIRDWLVSCGIRRVVMESTGVYWIPLFLMLQEADMEVILVNAKEVKNMSGRKTDVSDADWLRFLGSCDLIRPCYQIDAVSRRLRAYSRQRANKIADMGREVQHMQKAMEQMNIKLAGVLSDIVGKSGRTIISAILEGERDPRILASLADARCRKDNATISRALEGTWDVEHIFALRQAWETYHFLEKQVRECDTQMEIFLDSYGFGIENPSKVEEVRSHKSVCKKNIINVDLEAYAFQMYGVNLMKIPGASKSTLLTLMSELGPGFTDKFKTAGKFCKWCNLVPDDRITGGRVVSSNLPKRANPVGQAFRQCAVTIQKSQTPLGQYYRRMKGRLGPAQAVVATAHKIAELTYILVSRRVEYNEEITAKSETEITQRVIDRLEKKLQTLKNRQHQNPENH